MLPRMLQAIEVLQLPTLELSTFLRESFEQNEALALEEPTLTPGESWDAGPGRRGTRADSDRHDEMLRNQPAPEKGIDDLVAEQLAVLDVDPSVDLWARFLVGCLDENGYLSPTDAELLALGREAGLVGGERELGRAVALLQRLEPRGIGGRDAIEALLLQLEPDDPEYALLCTLLEDFLDDIAHNKLPSVARAMGLDVARLNELVSTLRTLDPRPVAGLIADASPAIHPEVVVEPDGDGFSIRIDHSTLPTLSIDPDVRAVSRDRTQPTEVRQYLRGRIGQARVLVKAVEQRRETLLRVASALFEHQRAFLQHGPGHMVGLRMNQVADEVGVHLSTVSRSVGGKYVQTPWGVHPLRWFFQSSAGGANAAREDVREVLRRVIEGEDASKPWSDDELAAAMETRGHPMARRTVAKYRGELGIPSSYRRRRFAG